MDNTSLPLLARQPILNRRQKVVGYELLCRPVPQDTRQWQDVFGDHATSEVLISAFNDIGIDQVTGGLPAFINFTRHWLHNPPMLPANRLVAELLEYIEPDAENLQALQSLRKFGYRIALDDYQGDAAPVALFPLVDIVKVDIRRLPDLAMLPQLIEEHKAHGLKWLAEKVETREEFEFCQAAGCDLFQGYFFSHPANVYGKRLPDSQLAVLQILKVLNTPDARINDVADVLQTDPQLSYKLLKLVNSAAMGFVSAVSSIPHAIMLVGLDRLRSWSNLIALGKLQHKPDVLREQAVVRAHLCKAMVFAWPGLDEETAFTLGLFSLLDAFFDHPLTEICQQLHLPESLTQALLKHQGDYGLILATTVAMEKGRWEEIDWPLLQGLGLEPADMERHYLNALHTTRELFGQLGG